MKAVVVGLGYVGLPLAHAASMAGVQVTGLDLNSDVVSRLSAFPLNTGRHHDQCRRGVSPVALLK